MKRDHEVLRVNHIVAILVEFFEDFDEFFLSLVRVVESLDHEANELVKVHFSIAVVVDLPNQLIDALGRGGLAETRHRLSNLIIVDTSVTSRVENIEDLFVLIDLLLRQITIYNLFLLVQFRLEDRLLAGVVRIVIHPFIYISNSNYYYKYIND